MAHSVSWTAAFDATPAGTDAISGGDDRIRELKTAMSERMALEHYFTKAGTNDWHGRHALTYTYITATTYTLLVSDTYVCCYNAASQVITVPAGSTLFVGKRFIVKQFGAGSVTVTMSGTDSLDTAATFALTTLYDWVEFVYAGGGSWHIIGRSYGTEWAAVASWTDFTPTTGWTAVTQCSYWRDPIGQVWLKGQANGSGSAATTFYTIPTANCRPAQQSFYPVNGINTGGQMWMMNVNTNGVITVPAYTIGYYVCLDGVSYKGA